MARFRGVCRRCEKDFQPKGKYVRFCDSCNGSRAGRTPNKKPTKVEMELNYKMYKEGYTYYKDVERLRIKAFIKNSPRKLLIDVLKSEKIIEQDWLMKGNKYKQREK